MNLDQLDSIAPMTGLLPHVVLWLQESSGPVSPHYFYQTEIKVTVHAAANVDTTALAAEEQKISLYVKHYTNDKQNEHTYSLPRESYRSLWQDLLAQDINARSKDFIGEQGRTKIGVSFNFFQAIVGDQQVARFDYRLRDIDDEDETETLPFLQIVNRLKRLAAEAAA